MAVMASMYSTGGTNEIPAQKPAQALSNAVKSEKAKVIQVVFFLFIFGRDF